MVGVVSIGSGRCHVTEDLFHGVCPLFGYTPRQQARQRGNWISPSQPWSTGGLVGRVAAGSEGAEALAGGGGRLAAEYSAVS